MLTGVRHFAHLAFPEDTPMFDQHPFLEFYNDDRITAHRKQLVPMIDIHFTKSNGEYKVLSNLADKPFSIDGHWSRSIEGVLQSFKTHDPELQYQLMEMSGLAAKKAGSTLIWQNTQILWWNGKPYDRHGPEYQELLDRVFGMCYAQSVAFRNALRQTRGMALEHSIGRVDPHETILTRLEFLTRLQTLRDDVA